MNAEGSVGAWAADVFLYLFGYLAYLLPAGLFMGAWRVCRESPTDRAEPYHYPLLGLRFCGALMAIAGSSGLLSLHFHGMPSWVPFASGGVLGNVIASSLVNILNGLGASLALFVGALVGLTLLTGLSWLRLADFIGAKTLVLWALVSERVNAQREHRLAQREQSEDQDRLMKSAPTPRRTKERVEPEVRTVLKTKPEIVRVEPKITGLASIEPEEISVEEPAPIPIKPRVINKPKPEKVDFDAKLAGTLPPLDLLDPPDNKIEKAIAINNLKKCPA